MLRWILFTALGLLLLDEGLRIALLVTQPVQTSLAGAAAVLAGGLLRDVLVVLTAGALPAALLLLVRPPLLNGRWGRWILATLVLGGGAFATAIEWFFFDEFSSRFNHIALDYVLYPHEVLTNIWQSYNVPLFVGIALIIGGVLALPHLRPVPASLPVPGRRRLAHAALACLIGGLALGVLALLPESGAADRRVREIAANGLQQLAIAARTSHLDYSAFYATTDQAAAVAAVEGAHGPTTDAFPQRTFTPVGAPGRDRPDVIVVLEESLGAEFIGRLGGNATLSPGFDRWADKGLLLTNLYATGNRTVRGMEGVLCSMVPLPGDAIVKRDRTDGCASLAGVLGKAGYRTEFLYGGAATFDNLGPFATATGYGQVLDDGVLGTSGAFPSDAFRTAWGVADGHLFDLLLARQRQARSDREPVFLTALTVSNHKPFLLPPGHGTDGRPWDLRRVGRYAGLTAGVLALGALLIVFGRRTIGLPLAIGIPVIGLIVVGVVAYQKMKPSGTRDGAVAYALDSVADWLDTAEREGLLADTVVLVVGDHGARVYGAAEMPLASYRVPALFLTPETAWRGRTIDRLASQVDLAPTLLSLAGIRYRAPFFGDNLLQRPQGPGRAFLQHNRNIAAMDDERMVVLGLQRSVTRYRRSGSGGGDLVPSGSDDPGFAALERLTTGTFQMADILYQERRYRLP